MATVELSIKQFDELRHAARMAEVERDVARWQNDKWSESVKMFIQERQVLDLLCSCQTLGMSTDAIAANLGRGPEEVALCLDLLRDKQKVRKVLVNHRPTWIEVKDGRS